MSLASVQRLGRISYVVCSGSMPTEPAFFRSSSHAMPMTIGRLGWVRSRTETSNSSRERGLPSLIQFATQLMTLLKSKSVAGCVLR